MAVYLITGGAGFVGSHLAEALVAREHAVRVLDNLSTGALASLDPLRKQIEIIEGDVADGECVARAMEGVEIVFHLAGPNSWEQSLADPLGTHTACVTGTLQVLLAARAAHVRRVIFGSCASVYGEGEARPRGECDLLRPATPYAVAKLAAEHYCVAFTQNFALETVRLRYFSVFGCRQRPTSSSEGLIPLLLEALRTGERPTIRGDSGQTRDFTSVDDVVQANLLAAEAPRVSGRVYNIASGRAITLAQLLERICLLTGKEIRPIYTPAGPGDIRDSQADISRAQAELGFCPYVDLQKGLKCCIEDDATRKTRPRLRHRRSPSLKALSGS